MALTITGFAQDREKETVIAAPATPFTYQGKLTVGGTAANGSYDFIIGIYSEPDGDSMLGEQTIEGVQVVNGIFTVSLEFETGAFQRFETAYLDIQVRPEREGDYTRLLPRQQIGSTPYAKIADSAREADLLTCSNCITDGQIVSVAGSKVTGTVANATNAVNATNATNAVTAQNALNAVDLTSDQTIGGDKRFTGVLNGLGGFAGDGSGLTNVSGTLRWNVVSGTSVTASPNNAYVATNAGQTVITLPASANPGDVIKIRSQGDGGFRISQQAGQQILASNIPNNTFVFHPKGNNGSWRSITSSADGSKLAAVSNNALFTSTDSGETWTQQNTGGSGNWVSITSSADGTKLAAVRTNISGERIYTSTDSGVTWTIREHIRLWQSITSSADGTILAAGDNNGRIYISADSGETWVIRSLGSQVLRAITSSADGTKLAATGTGTFGSQIYTSTDSGLTWTARESNRQWNSITSSADGTKLAAVVLNGHIYTSTDSGITWTARMTDANRNWPSITSSADGTKLAAVVLGGQIWISTDSGSTWTARGSNRQWASITSSADGTKLAAGVSGGQIYTRGPALPATTAGTAGYLTGGKFSTIELVYIGSGQFVAVNATGNFIAF
ncbi:MAG: hypothetical protein KF855_15795 [Acidobacteria bacterium]|nr:hypothetical protein [Acidobacteriota bacterium]